MTSSFWLILLTVLAYGLVHSLLTSLTIKTKTHLLELGEQYAEYHRQTPMLIPSLVFPDSDHKS